MNRGYYGQPPASSKPGKPTRGMQLAGALMTTSEPVTGPMPGDLRRRALVDALDADMTRPIEGDGSALDWAQGLVRGGEAYFRARSARDEREAEREKLAQELERQRKQDERDANKPIAVSPGATLMRQDGTVIGTAPDSSSAGPIRAVEGDREIVLFDTRTGEEVGRRPIAPRPVGRSAVNMPPPPPGFVIDTRR